MVKTDSSLFYRTIKISFNDVGYWYFCLIDKPLISSLLSNPYYKKLYISHIKTIFTDNFLEGQYEVRAKELQKLIKNDLSRDKYKYYDDNQFATSLIQTQGKKSKIPGIVELMAKRSRILKKHPVMRIIPPTISEVTVLKREQYSTQLLNKFTISAKVDKLPKKVNLYYRYDKMESFSKVEMQDDGKMHRA